ncbi:bifunctional DNA-formamidopyrimidine glycosylase/DNA-(apurinic or apyrimidinic site) lyase [Microbacterium sediminis]|uniref:Formamidopyrimidine-DNA glycosylase n=1 Tax=Microbacterium sediminis TaxID=904291 RepID=A0A1B9NFC1_9MICO|nr:bifunctional DNA-formamidopyrimidine glycosylase/DNA-(apurinic or apyrimidinic site) lyase [Microbacterium sediminis]OCG75306.1 DNA-formamidopyrimidine glycosylase [Microbacterium sediminis]QBR74327.1 bifunctional DNA-formamidopyrimidine glycosylase/DNA-(apurinic or apyrimidinic site) lyase [Microbacterium sediminis]
MPELPEVEVVRAGLAPAVTGATILGVEVFDPRALTRHAGSPADFEARLAGRAVRGTARRGKFLWLMLADDPAAGAEALMVHLGMSGQMLLRAPGAPAERHERVRFAIAHPEHGELAVVFADQRTFGSLAIDPLIPTLDGAAGGFGDDAPLVPAQAAHIARDPLDPAFDDAGFRRALARRSSAVKRVLLDQSVISGVGNIYADEALWAARLHPETRAADLSTRAANRLLAEVRAVLRKALAEGGTSFDAQYVNVNGEVGYFAHSLNAYGRAGQPCPRCGRAIVRVAFTNRSSHFCPRCQRVR